MELESATRTRGRAAVPIDATAIAELTAEDIALLSVEKGSTPSAVKRITDRHHTVARLLAEGRPEAEVAGVCGYSASRISILKADPAFQELLQFYRTTVTDIFQDQQELLASISKDAMLIIRDRMEDEPEKLSMSALMELTKMGADRTGNGPSSSQTNMNINVDLAGRLEAARKRVEARRIIDVD